ncbi:hypothetical protein EWM64_g6129 [Hericium alpestre]|uniref:Uncharacterized protein n=1 Tax=Hericium alpestre TaxID=135208 RepID=A0A4Y9ZSV4_9AGAM|nr:hypothetical protein EWM64_g6129 [Hericium alpestre]
MDHSEVNPTVEEVVDYVNEKGVILRLSMKCAEEINGILIVAIYEEVLRAVR